MPGIVTFLMLLFTVRDIGGVGINPYALTLLLSGIACLLSYKNLVTFICFLLPLSCGIQSFIWLVLAGCILFRHQKVAKFAIILFVLFLCLEIVDQTCMSVATVNIKYTIFYLSSLFLVFNMSCEDNRELDYPKNIKYFICGTCFLLVILFTRIILHYGIEEILTGAVRYKLDDTTLSGDYVFFANANNLGLYAAVCFTTLLFVGKESLKMQKSEYTLAYIVVILGGMLTFSRTWIILTVLSLLSYLLLVKKNKSFFFVLFLTICLAVLASSSDYFKAIFEIFEARLKAEDLQDGAGRIDLLKLYNVFFSQNPQYWLTGTGAVYYQSICKQPNSMHNMIQQTYVCYGALGVVGVGALFYHIYHTNKKYIKSIMLYAPFVCYLIFIQTVQFFNPIFCMYPLVLCVYCLRVKGERNAKS